MPDLFDFSSVYAILKMVRVFHNLKVHSAKIIRANPTTLTCLVYADQPRVMDFDRRTGICLLGPEQGLLVNRNGEITEQFVQQLRESLHDALRSGRLPPETAAVLRDHLSGKYER